MAENRLLEIFKHPRPNKTANTHRTSLVALASATKALKKVTPSSKTLQSLLSSATLMHPEIFPEGHPTVADTSSPLARANDASQQSFIQQPLDANLDSLLPLKVDLPSDSAEDNHDAKVQSQSTISQRHRTFASSIESDYHTQSSLELQRTESLWSTQSGSGTGQSAITIDSPRSGTDNFRRTFCHDPVHIHGSQMIHVQDIAPMIELHMLVWRDDRFLRRLQCNQVPSAEAQAMMKMLGDRTTSALDNVLVARINNSHDPMDIVGWLSCSIVRSKTNDRRMTIENEIRAIDWNLATAANLNKSHNAGSITCLLGDSKSLKERNFLIDALCRGTRWSQKQEFRDQVRIPTLFVMPALCSCLSAKLGLGAKNPASPLLCRYTWLRTPHPPKEIY